MKKQKNYKKLSQVGIIRRCARKESTSEIDFYQWLESSSEKEYMDLHRIWCDPILLYQEFIKKENAVYGIKKWKECRTIFNEIVKYEMLRRSKRVKKDES